MARSGKRAPQPGPVDAAKSGAKNRLFHAQKRRFTKPNACWVGIQALEIGRRVSAFGHFFAVCRQFNDFLIFRVRSPLP
jgi:hypothetical protein